MENSIKHKPGGAANPRRKAGGMADWTSAEIVELMIYSDSEGFSKGLNSKWHSPKWYALESVLRERHGANWSEVLSATA